MIHRKKFRYTVIIGMFFVAAFFILSLKYGVSSPQGSRELMITEVMLENTSASPSFVGVYHDYIEVYNPTGQTLNLADYYLSDSKKKLHTWQLPGIPLSPKSFTLFKCTGEGAMAETNFKLKDQGECLILSKADGTIVQQLLVDDAGPNIAYGYDQGSKSYGYFLEPSPLAMSTGPHFEDPQDLKLKSRLKWSAQGGIYDQPFSLNLSVGLKDCEIRYTTDGSEPSLASPLYDSKAGLAIADVSPLPNRHSNLRSVSYYSLESHDWLVPRSPVTKGNIIRAQVFIDGKPIHRPETRTYWVLEGGRDHYDLPLVSVTTAPENLFDDEKGFFVLGNVYKDFVKSNPGAPFDGETPANYTQRGPDWQRAGHFEYVVDGRQVFSQGIGLSCFGGWSRSNVKKSLKISASTQYDPDHDRLAYPLIKNATDQYGGRIKSFKHVALRGGSNDYEGAVFRDELVHSLAKDMGVATQGYQAVNLFLNGEYWGIYWIREVLDRYYLEDHFGVNRDDVTMISGEDELSEGTETGFQDYKGFLRLLQSVNSNNPGHYQRVTEVIDIDNFIDYQWIEIFSGNNDWPGNNVKLWRGGESASPDLQKWRYLLFDADFGFNLYDDDISHYSYNHFKFASDPSGPYWPNPPWSTFVFRKLLEFPDFKTRFFERGRDLMANELSEAVVEDRIEAFTALLEKDMPENIARYNLYELSSMDDWKNTVETMIDFAKHRPGVIAEIIEEEMEKSVVKK